MGVSLPKFDEEIASIADTEEEKELQKAKKVLAKAEEIIARGGSGAKWLREKLNQLIA